MSTCHYVVVLLVKTYTSLSKLEVGGDTAKKTLNKL